MHLFDFSNEIQAQKNILPTPSLFIPTINKEDFIAGYDSVVLR
jgi:hypothetical protein